MIRTILQYKFNNKIEYIEIVFYSFWFETWKKNKTQRQEKSINFIEFLFVVLDMKQHFKAICDKSLGTTHGYESPPCMSHVVVGHGCSTHQVILATSASQRRTELTTLETVGAGATAGLIELLCLFPLDVVKTRMMLGAWYDVYVRVNSIPSLLFPGTTLLGLWTRCVDFGVRWSCRVDLLWCFSGPWIYCVAVICDEAVD